MSELQVPALFLLLLCHRYWMQVILEAMNCYSRLRF